MLLLSSACSEGWNLYFEAIFVSCFFPSSTLLQTIEAADLLLFLSTISTVTVTSSIDPHFWHFLSCLLRLTHVDVNLVVKGKSERVSEGKAFTPVLAPRGEVSFYHWTSCGAQKSVKRVTKGCEDTHTYRHTHSGTYKRTQDGEHSGSHSWNTHRQNHAQTQKAQPWKHTYCLFTHRSLTSCCIFLFHTNNAASSQPNHNYKSQVQTARSCAQGQRQIKIKPVICSYLCCNMVKWSGIITDSAVK